MNFHPQFTKCTQERLLYVTPVVNIVVNMSTKIATIYNLNKHLIKNQIFKMISTLSTPCENVYFSIPSKCKIWGPSVSTQRVLLSPQTPGTRKLPLEFLLNTGFSNT